MRLCPPTSVPARSMLLCALLGGCVVGEDAPPLPGGEDEPPPPSAEAAGVVIQPRHGSVVTGATAQAAIPLLGLHTRPGYRIDVQVLANPTDLNSWTTIGSTRTADAPSVDAPGEQLYAWDAAIVPNREDATRWPQGGLLRVRAIGEDQAPLARLYHDSDPCLLEVPGSTISDQVRRCGDTVDTGLVVVSADATLADSLIARPLFLTSRGIGSAAETAEYYATIGAPATVGEFRTRFGFDAAIDPVATYYNVGDLATGREIRCRPYTLAATSGVACLTSNYGGFSGNPQQSLELAIQGTETGTSVGAFAIVAMVYQQPITAPNAVQFMVYGAGGALVNEAELDTHGDNPSIPHNCINCHGTRATYDPVANAVSDARFLPFDPRAFTFSDTPGYTRLAQEEPIRRLNAVIQDAGLTVAQHELLDGMYRLPVTTPGATIDDSFAPASWKTSLAAAKTYENAVAPFCRACHTSREVAGGNDAYAFTSAAGMRAAAPSINRVVCGVRGNPASHTMPNAQAVVRRFWASPARAYLADFLELPGSCAP